MKKAASRKNYSTGSLERSGSVGKRNKQTITAEVITKSSKFLRHKHHTYTRQNPCKDEETFKILKGALKAKKVGFVELFRFATWVEYLIMSVGVIFAVLAAIFCALSVYTYGLFFREAEDILDKCGPAVRNFAGIYAATGFILCVFLFNVCFHVTATKQIYRLRVAYMEALVRKDFTWFESLSDRELGLRMIHDTYDVRVGIGEIWPQLVFSFTAAIAMVGTSFYIHWFITVITSCTAPVYTIASYVKTRADANLKKHENILYENANTISAEILAKIKTIKMFGGEARAVEVYRMNLFSPWQLSRTVIWTAVWSGLSWFLPMCFFAVLCWVVIIYEDKIVSLSPGNFFNNTCATLKPEYYWRPMQHSPLYGSLDMISLNLGLTCYFLSYVPVLLSKVKRARFVAAEIFYTIDSKSYIDNLAEGGQVKQNPVGKIEIHEVSFNYPLRNHRQILNSMTFTVYPGQIVALFGPSLCGKSTIIKLMVRLFEPCQGTIKLDGEEIFTYSLPWMRTKVAYVSQNPHVLNATVGENICGFGAVDQENLHSACKKAFILDDILRLPKGFDTLVGKKSNVQLSKSEIKKLWLARAFYLKSRVLLLDDFFSDLNETDEMLLREELEGMRNKLTIVVTSRKFNPLMKTCDVIFVMRDGNIVQYGNHENISKTQGEYTQMLQDTLVDVSTGGDGKPKNDSQLGYYKFAEAIIRSHENHDKRTNVDFNLLWDHGLPVQSVYLRHVMGRYQRHPVTRLIGGFYRFINFDFITTSSSKEKSLRSNLLRERDLRTKIMPHPEHPGHTVIPSKKKGADGKFIPLVDLLRPTGSKQSASKEAHEAEHESGSLKLLTNRMHGKKSWSIMPGLKLQGKQSSSLIWSNLAGGGGKHRFSKSHTGSDMARKRKDDFTEKRLLNKLKHYFGITINSALDDESIASEDSRRFWNDYSERLELTLEDTRRPIRKTELFKLTRHSWPHLVGAFVTANALGIVLCCSISVTAEIAFHYLSLQKLTLIDECKFLLIIAFVALVVAFGQEVALSLSSCRINNQFRVALFSSLLEQDLTWFDEPRNDIGILCDNLATDTVSINTAFLAGVTIYSQAFLVFWYVCWFVITDNEIWKEQATLVVVVPVVILSTYLKGRVLITHKMKMLKRLAGGSRIVCDLVSYAEIVIAGGMSKDLLEYFKVAVGGATRLGWLLSINFIIGLAEGIFFLAFAVWSHVWRYRLYNDPAELIDFYKVVYLLMLAYVPMGYALATVPTLKQTCAAATVIVETENFSKRQTKLNRKKKSLIFGSIIHAPGIRAHNIKFSFPSSPELVLKGVSFEIAAESFVALVGPNKCGKSTLIALLVRAYKQTGGSLFLGEYSYNDINEKNLRRSIAVVEQDPDLFLQASIAENIAYGDNSRNVRQLEVVEAAKIALIHDLVEQLPDTYQTKLQDLPTGPETYALKQRIAVARAAIKNARVLIVDEATVSVDPSNTKLLLQSLIKLRQGKTFIVASQRIEPIRRADKIIVLQDGWVAETGTDQELLDAKGIYYDLLMRQRLYEKQSDIASHSTFDWGEGQ